MLFGVRIASFWLGSIGTNKRAPECSSYSLVIDSELDLVYSFAVWNVCEYLPLVSCHIGALNFSAIRIQVLVPTSCRGRFGTPNRCNSLATRQATP